MAPSETELKIFVQMNWNCGWRETARLAEIHFGEDLRGRVLDIVKGLMVVR